jgi:hypothetical protein
MFLPSKRVIYSILFFIAIMSILIVTKPKSFYQKDGKLKCFGMYGDDTLFSLGFITIVVAILVFYMFCIIDFFTDK